MSILLDTARSLVAVGVLAAVAFAQHDAVGALAEGADARCAALLGARVDIYEETTHQHVHDGPTAARRVVVRLDGPRQRFEQWHVEAVRRPVSGLPTVEDPWERASWVEGRGRHSITVTDGERALVLGEHHSRPDAWSGRRVRASSDSVRRDVLEGIIALAEHSAGFNGYRALTDESIDGVFDCLLLSPSGAFVRVTAPVRGTLQGTRFERFSCPPDDEAALRGGTKSADNVRRRYVSVYHVLETTQFRGVEMPSRLAHTHGITTRTRWVRYGELDAADGWADPRRPAGLEGLVATFHPETGAFEWMDARAWAAADVDDDARFAALHARR